ncbi:hypothetical protein GIB67_030456 [Kingdonia uniflora]|uniref:BRCT domain-containing protein n=1 Tax=Kingdonia uniflora TaxID=39325 RepID=A0A7J7P7R0_9MAGN|nr:hypothetical protein GIB67_030456 [Kingdonia uniflora]
MSGKRNLPSWMNSRETAETSRKSKKPINESENPIDHPKLLEGVVFVLSGFVNPERSALRSQALEMGAEYQQDWNSECTLLICAFQNTPKFRQVAADGGTIVSKEWISDCYNQKRLVDIETYLMNVGKPWRKSNFSLEVSQDDESAPSSTPQTKVERSPQPNSSVSYESRRPFKEHFSPSKVKKWVMDDLNKTVTWLNSQEERPEASEVKKIAAEGILTCLQDAIESLEQNQDIRHATEQWKCIPHVVEELSALESGRNSKSSFSKEDLYEQAMTCKRIYEAEYNSFEDCSTSRKKSSKAGNRDVKKTKIESVDAAYDSDETIEMTEEEIDLAYKTIASKICT